MQVISDSKAPGITSIDPPDNSTGMPVTTITITINFDDLSEIDPSSLSGALHFTSLEEGIVSTPTYSNKTAVYTISGLKYGVNYTLNIFGVRDMAGNTMTSVSPYEYAFTTQMSSNANLATLGISDGTADMKPGFNPNKHTYFCPVPYALSSDNILTVIPDPQESHAVVDITVSNINGATAVAEIPAKVPVIPGHNTITVTVTAQDGTTKDYTLNVYRAVPVYSANPNDMEDKGIPWGANTRFNLINSSVIEDTLTGLEWQKNSPLSIKNWSALLLTANTATDWHLPNIRELRSLFHYGKTNGTSWLEFPSGPSPAFFSIFQGYYWTSTGYSDTSAFVLNIDTYLSDIQQITSNLHTFYVRNSSSAPYQTVPKTGQEISFDQGGRDDGALSEIVGVPWPGYSSNLGTRFRNNNNGTIKDFLTGLTWIADTNAGLINWAGAQSKISSINSASVGGKSDWRLPSINELETLINYNSGTVDLPATPTGYLRDNGFTNVQERYWTSTSSAADTNQAWVIYFDNPSGSPVFTTGDKNNINTIHGVWAVRGPD